jgi:hypothetical protein
MADLAGEGAALVLFGVQARLQIAHGLPQGHVVGHRRKRVRLPVHAGTEREREREGATDRQTQTDRPPLPP